MHLAVMKHGLFPLIPRNIEALLHDRAMDIEVSLLGIHGADLVSSSKMRSKSFFIGKERFLQICISPNPC